MQSLVDLAEECPEAVRLLRGRTFARAPVTPPKTAGGRRAHGQIAGPSAAELLRPNSDVSLTTTRWGAITLAPNCQCGTTWMTLSTDSKYPSRRAYVVNLRSDATPDALIGRLENLVTGRRCEFTSARELLGLIAGDIDEPARPEAV